MNALEIVRSVKAHGAQLVLKDGQLVVRGRGEGLPGDVLNAVREHKAEIMVALGVPLDHTVASILADIRPHLAPALRALPDDRLLALVNSNIINAWNRAMRSAGAPSARASGGGRP